MLVVAGLKRVVEGQPIIEACSFTLERGQVLFITGPSGCGKTLLMRAIACLDRAQVRKPQEAHVLFWTCLHFCATTSV